MLYVTWFSHTLNPTFSVNKSTHRRWLSFLSQILHVNRVHLFLLHNIDYGNVVKLLRVLHYNRRKVTTWVYIPWFLAREQLGSWCWRWLGNLNHQTSSPRILAAATNFQPCNQIEKRTCPSFSPPVWPVCQITMEPTDILWELVDQLEDEWNIYLTSLSISKAWKLINKLTRVPRPSSYNVSASFSFRSWYLINSPAWRRKTHDYCTSCVLHFRLSAISVFLLKFFF